MPAGPTRRCAADRSGRRRRRRRVRRSARRTPSGGSASCSCSHRPKASSNSRAAGGSVSTSNSGSTRASTGRSRSRSAQKPWMVLTCASSSLVSAASSASRRFARLRRGALAIEPLAQPQLQLAGGLLGEGRPRRSSSTLVRPSARIRTIRPTSSVVLPVPAAASTISVSSRAVAIRRARRRGQLGNAGRCPTVVRHPPQRREVGDRVGRLPAQVPRFVGAADRAEIAPGAGALGRRRRKESELDGAIDDLERLEPGAPVRLGERHRMLGESAGRRAVEQPPAADRPAEQLLDREPVDDRLQRRAAADDGPRRRAVAAGLVIGDAQLLRAVLRFDHVDRSAQHEAAVDHDRSATLRSSRPSSDRPKLNSKYSASSLRLPAAS